eukprot:scaffold50951_cov84-Phaeocystis_antarctica.AAC.4
MAHDDGMLTTVSTQSGVLRAEQEARSRKKHVRGEARIAQLRPRVMQRRVTQTWSLQSDATQSDADVARHDACEAV